MITTARCRLLIILWLSFVSSATARADDLRPLFPGDRGPHLPAERAAELIPASAKHGIDLTSTEDVVDPNRFDVPAMTTLPNDLKPFEYVDVGPEIPKYTPAQQWGTQGEPLSQMQKPLPAAESLRHYVTPEGFELQLFADETQLASKPIAMNWDARGRLWVCETVDYPNHLSDENRGRDQIEIVEDTDGDGRGDKVTLFVDDLSIPTAILPLSDACLVQNGTETLYLADVDGDGRADVRETLISGWALGDTHGGVNNFRLGVDNWIYAMQGYNQSTPTIDGEPQQTFRMGFWRFRLEWPTDTGEAQDEAAAPHVAELEFLRSTDNNTWGLGLSEEGLIFGSTANHNPSVFMPIANRYYERVRGWAPRTLETIADTFKFRPITDKVRQVDQHGGYTAGCGHALYTARAYPRQWWNRTALVCGPTGKLVGTFVLQRDGSGFQSSSPFNLIASNDEWSAPIVAEVGPDGNVWILDWYNFIVQHNPTPQGFETGKGHAYVTKLRDKRHGRISRLIYTGDQRSPDQIATCSEYEPVDLDDMSGEQLVAALKDPTMIVRQHAQRLLVERGQTDVVPALIALIENPKVDSIGLNTAAIHALWTLDGLVDLSADGTAQEAVTGALRHPSAGVRRNAVAALPQGSTSVLLEADLVHDEDAQVRLAALLALADQSPQPAVGNLIAELASSPSYPKDAWILDALTSAAATNAVAFLTSLAESDPSPDHNALNIASIVAEHAARSRLDASATLQLLSAMRSAAPPLSQSVLQRLSVGWPADLRLQLSDEQDEQLAALLPAVPGEAKADVIRLGIKLGSRAMQARVGEMVASLLATVEDDEANVNRRLEAARQLVQLQPSDEGIVTNLLDQVSAQSAPEMSTGILQALGGSVAKTLGEELVERTRSMSPAVREIALKTLLSRPATTAALLDGIEARTIPLDDLSLEQRRSLSTHPDEAIRERGRQLLSQGGGLPDSDRLKVLEALLPVTQKTGNVERGRKVFESQCAKCHRHGELGNDVGPNLTGMAVHPKRELLANIIDPSRSVEGNFRLYTVLGSDGRITNGMLAGETRTSIELIDAEAKRHVILREQIDRLLASPKSLMPDGFEKQVTPEQMTDLLEFLTDRGKFTPIDLRKQATIVSTRGMFNSRDSKVERLIFPDWKPKTFAGVPFLLVDPHGDRTPNVIMLNGPHGRFPPQMPQSVSLPCHMPAKAIHLLSGVSGWGYPTTEEGSVSMFVRLHYADGRTEDHELKNGVHFADYIRRIDVPESQFACALREQQIRYLSITPQRSEEIEQIELAKGADATAPIVMAVTVEAP